MPPSREPSQLSPTFPPSPSQSSTITASVRRNLFAAHLSRRPASAQLPGQAQAPPPQAPPPQHQRQPSSPPRLNALTSHPQLQARQMPMNDIYDPTVSPHHPLSPTTSAALFPSSSIIALHPITGRPILPNLPSLPGRLKLDADEGDDTGDEENDEEDGDHSDGDEEETRGPRNTHRGPGGVEYSDMVDNDDRSVSSPYAKEHYPTPSVAAEYIADAGEDSERIDRMLSEMMKRQRQRAKGKDARRYKGRSGGRRGSEDVAESEKEELMGLIMATLRKEVAMADEEAWIYGDFGVGQGGLGREEVGVYE